MSFCCDDFEYHTRGSHAHGDGSPALDQSDLDGSWNVFGCCGGECHMIVDIRFCPWCGFKLKEDDGTRREVSDASQAR